MSPDDTYRAALEQIAAALVRPGLTDMGAMFDRLQEVQTLALAALLPSKERAQ